MADNNYEDRIARLVKALSGYSPYRIGAGQSTDMYLLLEAHEAARLALSYEEEEASRIAKSTDKIDHGGFAFPFLSKTYEGNWNPFQRRYVPEGTTDHNQFPGMTVREYFAGQALAGLCANQTIGLGKEGIAKVIAEASVDLADALIAELNGPKYTG